MADIIQRAVNMQLGRIDDHTVDPRAYEKMKKIFALLLSDMHKFECGRTFTTMDLASYARSIGVDLGKDA